MSSWYARIVEPPSSVTLGMEISIISLVVEMISIRSEGFSDTLASTTLRYCTLLVEPLSLVASTWNLRVLPVSVDEKVKSYSNRYG